MSSFDPSIFKAYDIRGIYPDQLNEDTAYRVGRAYAQMIQEENPGKVLNIVISRDMRISSDTLHEQVVRALLDAGVHVIDIGIASTTTFYFAVGFYGYDGGIAVTASHNPNGWSGKQ